jgi:hypothetical protein
MNMYLKSLGFGILELVTTCYTAEARKDSSESYAKEIDVMLSGLSDSVKVKVMKCTSGKQIWDKIQKNYEERYVDCSSCEFETNEAQFVRNLNRGLGKYKGKPPIK